MQLEVHRNLDFNLQSLDCLFFLSPQSVIPPKGFKGTQNSQTIKDFFLKVSPQCLRAQGSSPLPLGKYLIEHLRVKRIACLYQNDTFGLAGLVKPPGFQTTCSRHIGGPWVRSPKCLG